MSLNGLFAVRKPPGLSSTQVLNTIQPLLKSSSYFKDHLISRDAPGKRTKRRRLNETKIKVLSAAFIRD
jgi:tRNA U55 pseudouridine synthase TruB